MPVWTARCRNQDPGCVSMGAIQRGTSWATIPKTLNRARTVHAPCAHRARTVRQRPLSAEKVVTTTPRTPAESVAPRSPGPRMGRAGTGSARRGRGEPPRINAGTRHAPPPHNGGYTRVPPVLPGRGGIGTPRGGLGAHKEFPSPHNGSYTRVPPVLPGPRRERGAPWGFGGTRRVPLPTQRRLHPSPSGPAWAVEG